MVHLGDFFENLKLAVDRTKIGGNAKIQRFSKYAKFGVTVCELRKKLLLIQSSEDDMS